MLLDPQTDAPHTSLSSTNLEGMRKRPAANLRRRSTRAYQVGALEDTVSRQKRWESVVEKNLVDVFFTIHRNHDGTLSMTWTLIVDDPLYISEQIFETMVCCIFGVFNVES